MIKNRFVLSYIFLISILLLSSCASKTYDWVKINPNRLAKANSAKSPSAGANYVDVRVNAKYKAENVVYVDNSDDYFSPKEIARLNRVKKQVLRKNNKSNQVKPTKSIQSVSVNKQNIVNSNTKLKEDESLSKLNKSLIIPNKKSIKEEQKVAENKPQEVVAENVNKQNNSNDDDNGLSQLENQDIALKNSEIKDSAVDAVSGNEFKDEAVKRNSYMWVGLMLLIAGLIVWLIFGGLAYFISIIGLVFILIGYITRV